MEQGMKQDTEHLTKKEVEQFLDGIGDRYIEEAGNPEKIFSRRRRIIRIAAAAAAVLIVAVLATGVIRKQILRNRKLDSTYPNDLPLSYSENARYMPMNGDWQEYPEPEDLVNACSDIYLGKLTDISYEVLDEGKGERILYTIYTVSVEKQYKGEKKDICRIGLYGGIPGYKEDEQYEKMVEAGLIERDSGMMIYYTCSNPRCNIAVGNTYLFCVKRYSGNPTFDNVINPNQFAYAPDSANAGSIIEWCK